MSNLKNSLQEILDINHDAVEGYKTAANAVSDDNMKTLFGRFSQQRRLFIEELKNEARIMGHEMSEETTVKGFFHRNWMDLKSNFGGSVDERVIDDAITGEKSAIEKYNEMLSVDMPKHLQEKMQEQHRFISGAIEQLHHLQTAVVS